jgi:hypothetical protein
VMRVVLGVCIGVAGAKAPRLLRSDEAVAEVERPLPRAGVDDDQAPQARESCSNGVAAVLLRQGTRRCRWHAAAIRSQQRRLDEVHGRGRSRGQPLHALRQLLPQRFNIDIELIYGSLCWPATSTMGGKTGVSVSGTASLNFVTDLDTVSSEAGSTCPVLNKPCGVVARKQLDWDCRHSRLNSTAGLWLDGCWFDCCWAPSCFCMTELCCRRPLLLDGPTLLGGFDLQCRCAVMNTSANEPTASASGYDG